MRINFDFNDIQAFLALIEYGSFQAAANQINTSQSALTRRIQKLESGLNVKLFERTTRSVHPTQAAKRFRATAQTMMADATQAVTVLQDESVQLQHQRNQLVTVAAVPSTLKRILPDAISQFRRDGHLARLSIMDRLSNDVANAVLQGDADFGIAPTPTLDPLLMFQPLFDDAIVLAMRRDHPLATRKEVKWSDLQSQELIVPGKATGNRLLIDEALSRLQRPLKWSTEVRRTSTAIDLVEAGIGVATLPNSALPNSALPDSALPICAPAKTSSRSGSVDFDRMITSRPLVDPSITRTIGLIHHGTRAMSKPATEFCNALKQSIYQH